MDEQLKIDQKTFLLIGKSLQNTVDCRFSLPPSCKVEGSLKLRGPKSEKELKGGR